MLTQVFDRYMAAVRDGTSMRPEDLGAVRLAMKMALDELQAQYRAGLNDMDDIIAQLLEERAQLRKAAQTDANEILRLQTMEDRLECWLSDNEPELAFDNAYERDVASFVIDLLSKRSAAVAPVAVNANGSGNGHVQITDLGTRYTGRRLNVNDDELRALAMAKIQRLAAELGRTPTQADWNNHLQPDEPSLTSTKARLRMNWNDMVVAAGLTPNLNSHQRAAQLAAHETEAKADAEAPFRGQ